MSSEETVGEDGCLIHDMILQGSRTGAKGEGAWNCATSSCKQEETMRVLMVGCKAFINDDGDYL